MTLRRREDAVNGRGSNRSHCVGNWFWKGQWTCKTACGISKLKEGVTSCACSTKVGDTLSSRHVSSCDVKAGDTLSSRHVSSCDVKAETHYPHVT